MIRRSDGTLRIGATVRQAALERSRARRAALAAARPGGAARRPRRDPRRAARVGGLGRARRPRPAAGRADRARRALRLRSATGAHADRRRVLPGPADDGARARRAARGDRRAAAPPGARTAFAEHARTRGDFPRPARRSCSPAATPRSRCSAPARVRSGHRGRAGAASRARARARPRRSPPSASRAAPPRAGRRGHAPRARRGGPRMRLAASTASPTRREVEPRTLLSDFIRDAGLTGTKVGCEQRRLRRVHGAARRRAGALLPDARRPGRRLRRAHDRGARARPAAGSPSTSTTRSSAGSARPGILMTLDAYLREHPDPTEDEVTEALAGNLCRCTGYRPIVERRPAAVTLRSKYDREILLLALPALGALASEPLYVLVDTAIVGHLGTTPARLAGDRGDGALDRVHDLQLPHLRHDRAGRRACTAPGATHDAARARLAGAVARARRSGSCCSCCSRSPRPRSSR